MQCLVTALPHVPELKAYYIRWLSFPQREVEWLGLIAVTPRPLRLYYGEALIEALGGDWMGGPGQSWALPVFFHFLNN